LKCLAVEVGEHSGLAFARDYVQQRLGKTYAIIAIALYREDNDMKQAVVLIDDLRKGLNA
jgi:hypothetical protein